MQCLNCNSKEFTSTPCYFLVDIAGKTKVIFNKSFVCGKCGENIMDTEQMNEMLRKYRMALKENADV